MNSKEAHKQMSLNDITSCLKKKKSSVLGESEAKDSITS